MLKLDNITLATLAPPSITRDKNIKAIFQALDPELQSVYDAVKEIHIYSRIDELPEKIIDALAWQWHIDFYELANNLETKRELVKSSIEWHRHKGTSYAILKALEFFGIEAKFIPWYEELVANPKDIHDLSEFPPLTGNDCLLTETVISKAQPYTFAIDARLQDTFFERVDWTKPTQTIKKAIIESKAARSYISRVHVHFEDYIQKELRIAQISPKGIYRRVNLNQPVNKSITHTINANSKITTAISLKMDIDKHDRAEFITQNLTLNNRLSSGMYLRKGIDASNDKSLTQNLTLSNLSNNALFDNLNAKN